MDIEYLKRCSQLCTECCSETCVFNPQGICMAPFLTGKKPGIHDDGCTDYCPKPLDGLELVCSYSEHELRSYEEDVREHISQFTDEELMEVYELDRTTLNSLAPRAAVLMRKYIDNDDSWTYHRDYAISEAVSEYKEDKDNCSSFTERKELYAWHISDLKIYDQPKSLSGFSRHDFRGMNGTDVCGNESCEHYQPSGSYMLPPTCAINGCCLSKPPQSWCYVAEAKEDDAL